MAKVYDNLKLSSYEVEMLIEQLERASEGGAESKREKKRWTLGGLRVVLSCQDKSGQTQNEIAIARNLSSSGAAVLTGKFLYPDSRCVVACQDLHGKVRQVRGRVVRCRHLQGRVHDVGIRFDSTVNPREFIEFGGETAFNTERVNVAELHGQLLIIDSSRADQKLICHYFAGSGLELVYAQDGESGLMMLDDQPDFSFVSESLRDMSGIDVIRTARERGYSGPIVLLANESRVTDRDRAIEAGANESLVKPCAPELLHQAVAEYLLGGQARGGDELSRIETSVDLGMVSPELVCEYIDGLMEETELLVDAIEKEDIDRVRKVLRSIGGTSGSYGFEPIGRIASLALMQVDTTQSLGDSMLEVQRLIGACHRIRKPKIDPPGEVDGGGDG